MLFPVGEYAVHILVNDEDIPSSPFLANIITPPNGYKLDFDASKVLISGPGIEGAVLNTQTQFTVDARPAFPEGTPSGRAPGSSRPSSMIGATPTPPSSPPAAGSPLHRPLSFLTSAPFSFTPNLQVQVLDTSTGLLLDVHAAPTHEGPTNYSYTARTTAKHLVYVVLGGLNAGKSPFRVRPSLISTCTHAFIQYLLFIYKYFYEYYQLSRNSNEAKLILMNNFAIVFFLFPTFQLERRETKLKYLFIKLNS